MLTEKLVHAFNLLSTAVLLAAALAFAATSWHWPLVGDAALLHYIIFLTDRGLTPYRDIPDLNLPGALFAESAVIHVFGPGALSWRVFDLFLLAAIAAAGYAICRPHKQAALFAATVFALIHGRDGLIQLGQRDLLMAALLVSACAFSLRLTLPRSLLAGVCLGAACTVKPSALLFAFPLPARLAWGSHPRRKPLLVLFAGMTLPLAASLASLLHHHALSAFLQLEIHLAPYHGSLFRLSFGKLAAQSVSSVLLPIFAAWVFLFLKQRRWRNGTEQLLLAGFLCGVLSFWIQGRGYPYHRYPSEVFLLLLAGLAFTGTLRGLANGPQKAVAVLALIFGTFVVVPKSLLQTTRFTWAHDPFRQALSSDLATLGARDGQVQCLDQAGGCITTLLHAQLTQSTGFLYDCYLYPQTTYTRERDRYRAAFQQALTRNPPRLIIATSDECGPADSTYAKLNRWPWLATYLAANYTLSREYHPTTPQSWGGKPALPYGYRIYRRSASEEKPR